MLYTADVRVTIELEAENETDAIAQVNAIFGEAPIENRVEGVVAKTIGERTIPEHEDLAKDREERAAKLEKERAARDKKLVKEGEKMDKAREKEAVPA